jgi:hypothetical protein
MPRLVAQARMTGRGILDMDILLSVGVLEDKKRGKLAVA